MEKQRNTVKVLKRKASEFIHDPVQNANHLVELANHLETGQDTVPCLMALEMVFVHAVKNRLMVNEVVPLKIVESTPEVEYKKWMKEIYDKCNGKMVQCLEVKGQVQIQALVTMMTLLREESKQINQIANRKLRLILRTVLESPELTLRFTEYVTYPDVTLNVWKLLTNLITSHENENILTLIERMPIAFKDFGEQPQQFCIDDFHYDEHAAKKYLNKVWGYVMQWDMNQKVLKQVLILLIEKVMSHLEKPVTLIDFMMDSIDVGGATSVLALQGIFNLVTQHNLEYPNIYSKLYSMFEPEIFHTKYKQRLYHLTDMFLTSTHLPELLVAAFIKRLARLSLVAPSVDIIIIVKFVSNLILRHPGLKRLINNTGYVNSDPYIMDECDPYKSNAINSSLWEIETLRSHVNPEVAQAAAVVFKGLPEMESDIRELLDKDSDDMFDDLMIKNKRQIAMAFERPEGLTLEYWRF